MAHREPMRKSPATSRLPSNAPAKGRPMGSGRRFVLVFAGLVILFYAIAAWPWFSEGVFPANLRLNTQIACGVLRVMGEDANGQDRMIVSPRFAMEVRRGCDALEPAAIYLAAVLAFPARWRARLAGALTGLGVLFALNIVRIVSLYWIGVRWPEAFESAHLEIWQTLFVVVAMALWIGWAWRASDAPRADRPKGEPHAPG